MTGTSYTPRNIFSEYIQFSVTFPASDIDTDSNGDVTLTIPFVKKIVESSVTAVAEGGYKASVQSVSKNQVTIRIYQGDYDKSSDAPFAAVASGADLTILHVSGLAE